MKSRIPLVVALAASILAFGLATPHVAKANPSHDDLADVVAIACDSSSNTVSLQVRIPAGSGTFYYDGDLVVGEFGDEIEFEGQAEAGPQEQLVWTTISDPSFVEGAEVLMYEGLNIDEEFGVSTICTPSGQDFAVTVWGANAPSVIWQMLGSDGKWWWVTQPGTNTNLVTPIEYRNRTNEQGQVVSNYPLSRLTVKVGVGSTDPAKYKPFNAVTGEELHGVWVEIGAEGSPNRKSVYIP